jgi:formylglycine-generating enzyme required for sulfatase activity
VVASLTRAPLHFVKEWSDLLGPAKSQLRASLEEVFREKRGSDVGYAAAVVLAEHYGEDIAVLNKWLLEAGPNQLAALIPQLKPREDRAYALLSSTLPTEIEKDRTDFPLEQQEDESRAGDHAAKERRADALAKEQANALTAILALSKHRESVFPYLKYRQDPRLRSYLIQRLGRAGLPAQLLMDRFKREQEPSIRQALLLCLGQYSDMAFTSTEREQFAPQLLETYTDDPDAGVHSAAEWLLRQWEIDFSSERKKLASRGKDRLGDGFGWYVTPSHLTMVVVHAPVTFAMGLRPKSPHRLPAPLHAQPIDRAFAVSTTEIPGRLFCGVLNLPETDPPMPGDESPARSITWSEAVKFCRLLSEKEGLDEDEMCFPDAEQIGEDMQLRVEIREKTGYRLPFEDEWEYSCRGESITRRFYGNDDELLPGYAWFKRNTRDSPMSVGLLMPNKLGLFDSLGNVWELCHDSANVKDGIHHDNGQRPQARGMRILRGGSYESGPDDLLSGLLHLNPPNMAFRTVGFRVVRTLTSVNVVSDKSPDRGRESNE